jgi:tetratricopeptide (TPR) repeat protein
MATTSKTATPNPPPASLDGDEHPFLTPQRIRIFGIGGAAVLVLALAVWFVITSRQRKESYAALELERARDAAAQMNFGVATQGFTRIASAYAGTSAAFEATLGIAQTRLVAGQNELAISTLTDFLKTNPPPLYSAPANALLGAAYENTKKYAEAEAAYRKAAGIATVDYLKASNLLDAGRAARLANRTDEAKALYNEIITKYANTGAKTEAEVRLAEMTAVPAS